MNFHVDRGVKQIVKEYARQHGISMAAAASVLMVKGAASEGLDTSRLRNGS